MRSNTAKRLMLLLAAAFVVRLAVAAWWQSRLDGPFLFGDSESYWSLGRAIALGEPYRYGAAESWAFRTPGYPAMLTPIFLAAGPDAPAMWGRVVGCLCGMAAVGGVWWLARALFGATAGWIAGGIAAFYPGATATSVLVLSEGPFCPLMLANLGLWIVAWQTTRPGRAVGWALAAGVAAGAATLVRPSWLLFLPFAMLIGLAIGPRRGRHAVLGAAMAAGLVAVMCPWWIRNGRVLGRFVPTTTQVGASLYDGLSPEATGASQMDFVEPFLEDERDRERKTQEPGSERGDPGRHFGKGGQAAHGTPLLNGQAAHGTPLLNGQAAHGTPLLNGQAGHGTRLPAARESVGSPNESETPLELRLDARLGEASLAWAKANPGPVARLAAVKFGRMWSPWPNEPSLSTWPVRAAMLVSYVPVVLLGLIGAVRTIRWGWAYVLMWLPAVYFTGLHTVFVSSIRYRQPAMLGLIVLAAGALAWRFAAGPPVVRSGEGTGA